MQPPGRPSPTSTIGSSDRDFSRQPIDERRLANAVDHERDVACAIVNHFGELVRRRLSTSGQQQVAQPNMEPPNRIKQLVDVRHLPGVSTRAL